MQAHDCDYLIVGSGFGGAVSALRLAEKGHRVIVAEQGRRIGPDEIEAGKRSSRKFLWLPELGLRGYFAQFFFRHVGIVAGVGVGGGSLVWGAVMLEPKAGFYRDPKLKRLGITEAAMRPHLDTAKRMLGVTPNPRLTRQDHLLERVAADFDRADTFGPVPQAIHFGEPGKTVPDPYFDGDGPERQGCRFCAGCMTGCPYGAKNSLDYNYLYLAEKSGVEVRPEHRADRIESMEGGGYRVAFKRKGAADMAITARRLILAGGVVGTLRLLFANRDRHRTLPNVSSMLGENVFTNSEAITAVLHPAGDDISDGTGISSDFYPDDHTHATQNRFDHGWQFMRPYFGPLVDDPKPWRRALRTLVASMRQLSLLVTNWFARGWEKRLTVFTVMQDLDNRLRFEHRRRWWWPFGPTMGTATVPGHEAPTYLPIANEIARRYAEHAGGRPMNLLPETLGNLSTTAHILGGCPMGVTADEGVIDENHEVHGHPGLFVVDGAAIPGNIGVNPSLTITALAERFAARQPAAESAAAPEMASS